MNLKLHLCICGRPVSEGEEAYSYPALITLSIGDQCSGLDTCPLDYSIGEFQLMADGFLGSTLII